MQHHPINTHRKDRDQLENADSPIAARRVWRRSRGGRAGKGRQMLSVQQLLGPVSSVTAVSASNGVPGDLAPLVASVAKQAGGRYLVVNPDVSRGIPVGQDIPIRLRYRTVLVLEAIAEQSGSSNIQVAQRAGITDPGQVSKLLARLQAHGLIHNTGRGQTRGAANQWRLTLQGQQLQQSIRTHTNDQRRAA